MVNLRILLVQLRIAPAAAEIKPSVSGDPQSGQSLATIRGYASWIQSVAFSPGATCWPVAANTTPPASGTCTSGACLGWPGGAQRRPPLRGLQPRRRVVGGGRV
jgi:hypothetical protein